jgi:hypothetical protein
MPSDGLFNVLIVLVRASVRLGPKPRQDLLRACGADLSLRKIVRTIALTPDNNSRFWESEENKSADLSRGLSWILAQNVYGVDTSSHAKIQPLENDQIADLSKRIFQNDTRWNGLRTWMVYLGFGRPGAQVAIDPTEALRDVLTEIFAGQTTLLAGDFVSSAAEILPVLDGGRYRKQMEEILNPAAWQPPPEGRLSTSLSRAIQRLEREGLIAVEARSDTAGGIVMQGTGRQAWRELTHVRLLKPKKAK